MAAPTNAQVLTQFAHYMGWSTPELMDEDSWEVNGHYLDLLEDGTWEVSVEVCYQGSRDEPPGTDDAPIGQAPTLIKALCMVAESELAERLAGIDEAIFPPVFDLTEDC